MSAFLKFLSKYAGGLARDHGGNFGAITAVLLPVLLVASGGAVDLSSAYYSRADMQVRLDAAVLAAASEATSSKRYDVAARFMVPFATTAGENGQKPLTVVTNGDGSVSGTYRGSVPNSFLSLLGIQKFDVVAQATAMKAGKVENVTNPCIRVLGNVSQAVLINSGAGVKSQECGVDVHSAAAPAFIMNSGASVDTAKFCVKGTNHIRNGGTLTNLELGCLVKPDPYAGKLPKPFVPEKCDTSGVQSGTTLMLKPGVHCDVIFNGSPKVTFKPGLHIIKGRMILNYGAIVDAQSVTFFFPDVDSEIRANGGLSFNASAPLSGVYAGLLMFEATGNPSNDASKRQYVFNGSLGETLSGIIYLPNRDVTYNSSTNQTSRISLVVNTMIMNSSNWRIEPYTSSLPFASSGNSVRLLN